MVFKAKNIFIVLGILLTLTCTNSLSVVVDKYFHTIYNIEDVKNVEITPLVEFSNNSLQSSSIYVSPLIYKFHKRVLTEYDGAVSVLGEVDNLYKENHHGVTFSSVEAYSELLKQLGSEDYSNISHINILIDVVTEIDKEELNLLKTLEDDFQVKILIKRPGINKSNIKKFIEGSMGTDLWIIDLKEEGLYAYENIESGDIIMKFGSILMENDDRIIYSIEHSFEDIITALEQNNTFLVEEYLKKE